MSRSIIDTIRHLHGGTFLDLASDSLAELVSAVDSTGKPGEITIKINVKKMSKGAMGVIGKLSLRKPQEAPDATLMFPTPDGDLLTQDPRQQNLELRTVPAQAETQLKKVGAN